MKQITLVDPREIKKTKPLKEVALISIHPDYPDRHVMIGTELLRNCGMLWWDFLRKTTISLHDLKTMLDPPRVDPHVAIHKLLKDLDHYPVRQK